MVIKITAAPKELIKSIQYGSILISDTSTSNTDTINSVDTTNSFLLFLGNTTTNVYVTFDDTFCRLELTNATTVTARRKHGYYNVSVSYCVIECYPDLIKSIQSGTVTISGTSATDTINSVDINKSMLLYLGCKVGHWGDNLRDAFCRIMLTNATTVTGTRSSSDQTTTAGYMVVEFY